MKSLEIVNESIEYIEFILKNDGGMDNEQKEQFKIILKKNKQIKQDLERYELILKRLYLTGIDNHKIIMIEIDGYSDEDRRDYFKLKDAVMDKLDEEFYKEFFDPNTKNEDDE